MPLTQQVPPIARGYHYALQLAVRTDDDGPFPAGAALVAQLRDYDGPLAGELSTASGSLFRVDDHHLELQVPAAVTARLGNTSAVIDIARTDEGEPDWLDISLRLPVVLPVTQVGTVSPGAPGGHAGPGVAIVSSDVPVTLSRCAVRVEATIATTPSSSARAAGTVQGFSTRASDLDLRLVALGA